MILSHFSQKIINIHLYISCKALCVQQLFLVAAK